MKLLNQSEEDQENLQKLMGDNKAEFLRKLEEKRRRRKELGLIGNLWCLIVFNETVIFLDKDSVNEQ